ncbi:uncharacterized protein LOC128550282 isoform X3 [Mercenaria mercenaria]|uniref:uncharacterized protein LOC128550282 isoform X3 n=1 Tax=Mercenaria mercenaria TaxID=6596 RepID=UPI00234E968C|nr:uncharacterized protein LOC128550282 isoform X3 [Mercenaria mercenaria]
MITIFIMKHNDMKEFEEGKEFLKSFLPQKVLTVAGVLLAFCSFGLTSLNPVETAGSDIVGEVPCDVPCEVPCIVSWIISGTLVFAAAGIQDQYNANFEKEVKMETSKLEIKDLLTITVGSPTSIIVFGVGGSVAMLLAVTIALMVIYRTRKSKPTERHSNQAI